MDESESNMEQIIALAAEIDGHKELIRGLEYANDALRAKLQAAEADALLANMKLSSCMDETDRLRARIAKLEAELVKTREELIEQVLSTDIWLSFDGKEWVMVSAVRQALHGEVE